ncbi:MAG: [FeFe] hydrogenase H-cluster maturation GTPase HydF, partial [Ruminococcus sp.]|nr:[FeFe] hydrogenase H-cluster maturation GTPase HydF [Ruminococcus sp.]
SMEILPLGPCVLIDTAGFDDIGELGETRVEKTKLAAEKTDIAVVLVSGDELSKEKEWFDYFVDRKIPVMLCISKADTLENPEEYKSFVEKEFKAAPIVLSSKTKEGLPEFKEQLLRSLPEDFEMPSITGDLCGENDLVMLVMPQDIQAPKGRLILPQVQTIRELLDKKCVVISCTTDKIDQTLSTLKNSPKLIICDSQVFKTVWEKKPDESRITSFSTLFAGYKGDIEYYIEGAESIDKLDESSKILIAECCTHAPLSEDIGREKLPRLLRKRLGEGLQVDFVSGSDFPEDLTKYDLVIQCGACMFNRRYVMSRIERAKEQGVMMSNYGVVIAKLNKILDKISY